MSTFTSLQPQNIDIANMDNECEGGEKRTIANEYDKSQKVKEENSQLYLADRSIFNSPLQVTRNISNPPKIKAKATQSVMRKNSEDNDTSDKSNSSEPKDNRNNKSKVVKALKF